MLRNQQVVEELGRRRNAADEEVIACPCAGDVEQVALAVVDLREIAVVGDGFDARLRGDDLVVAGHDGDRAKLQSLCEVHGGDGEMPLVRFDMLVQNLGRQSRLGNRCTRTLQLGLGADEDGDVMRFDGFGDVLGDPGGNRAGLLRGRLDAYGWTPSCKAR